MSDLEAWNSADAYELWVGRWSRQVAAGFVQWLAPAPGLRWADVGCGTGALADIALREGGASMLRGVDRAGGYVQAARERIADPRARFETGDALALPWADREFDVAVSGLVLNFVPDPARMLAEIKRVTRPGGTVAAYVWDYAGGMQMMRFFWDAVLQLRPGDAWLDQAERFPLCAPEPLRDAFEAAGLAEVDVRAIEIDMPFATFDDYWRPFLGRQGAAPAYLAKLPQEEQDRIREHLRAKFEARGQGTMPARAWAVRGRVPAQAA
ncbi:class I SAM-dependent methyltransferase [Ramlibacter albus]|uniref:Methyltransferase domain-containing protein n=1 Tax=Ramlibacter albus TaxID=2079448 RepID=A0A923MCM4_9BURK|nr:class I SAM-dependent methyltransferase [Ramlibacter albus]MBC5767716.1 methyltransferase domain-containing protein [Ramlibacter albus]